jgi:hypothetical protein
MRPSFCRRLLEVVDILHEGVHTVLHEFRDLPADKSRNACRRKMVRERELWTKKTEDFLYAKAFWREVINSFLVVKKGTLLWANIWYLPAWCSNHKALRDYLYSSYSLKALWLLYVPPALTHLKRCVLTTQPIVCVPYGSHKDAIKRLVFVAEK